MAATFALDTHLHPIYRYTKKSELHMNTRHVTVAALLVNLSLLALPGLRAFAEREQPTWQTRLALPQLVAEPNRHTPLFAHGTFLPPLITHDLTLTASQSPVLLTGPTRIPVGVTVRLLPGTAVYAHEFAHLEVEGRLEAKGEPTTPIRFVSNEAHPLNQVWGGIIFKNNGQGSLSHTVFAQAAPAISCLPGSTVSLTNSTISTTPLGVFIDSPTCRLTNTTIRSWGRDTTVVNR